jgi:hypothetical protein
MVIAAACHLLALAQVGASPPAGRTIAATIRAGAAEGTVEIEVRNVSSAQADTRGEATLMLRPLDPAQHPLYSGLLWTSVDLNAGKFDGFFAGRPSPRVVLEAGASRQLRVNLKNLMWSLAPNWVWQPRELWELAGAGEYEVVLYLNLDLSPPEHPWPQKTRIRIASQ